MDPKQLALLDYGQLPDDTYRPFTGNTYSALETSKAAADSMAGKAGTIRFDVLKVIVQAGPLGATDDEIQRSLVLNGSTQRPRRIELVDGGFVKESDARRMTLSGRLAIAWVATVLGQRVVSDAS